MRMMGAESVAYHRETVLERGDDHREAALSYYASRGETPLAWGGAGADILGLSGRVGDVEYLAMFGPGGAVNPRTGERLTLTCRPGMELVVSAHKSVTELGVIGHAEHMHQILDAEREGTLAYLDAVTQRIGGRRGRAAVVTPTGGMVYAHTRHATSREGDPCLHDHVLIANAVEMHDTKGGWKAPDTTTWREHLHAATAVGRVAAARTAVELGYAIRRDDGPSGKLGHWAIDGICDEALAVLSKRSAEINDALGAVGFDTYQARQVAARTTRKSKRHEAVTDLLPVWQQELADAGYPVAELDACIARAAAERTVAPERLADRELAELAAELLGPEGPLTERKVFARRDVIVAAAPLLFGRDPAELDRLTDRVLADPVAIPLVGVAGAKERVYATSWTIAREHAIAANIAEATERSDAPAVERCTVEAAVMTVENTLGGNLTAGQEAAVFGICTSGRAAELVLGVAGSGKTTALAAVAEAFGDAGFRVVGTATSGQAARTLGTAAGIDESRTVASLLWRLDNGRLTLDDATVLVLDEAGMTDDPSVLRLLVAAETAGAKVVLVGDDRQLGAVGPGGALGALLDRHPDAVWVLDENVRQHDPAERRVLGELRAGDVNAAVDWYAGNGRVRHAPTRDALLDRLVAGWAADSMVGADVALFAWRRANVDALNARARAWCGEHGRLSGPELTAPGRRRYRSGDRIVTLAPGADGQVVTSERGTVTAVDPTAGSLTARMDDGRTQAFGVEDTAADRLAHGYAVTVHRSQGATVDRAHALADGGGRELAYVALSRARDRSDVYVVADNAEQAIDDLKRDWDQERRARWVIDTGTPTTDPSAVEADPAVPLRIRTALGDARHHYEAEAAEAVAALPLAVGHDTAPCTGAVTAPPPVPAAYQRETVGPQRMVDDPGMVAAVAEALDPATLAGKLEAARARLAPPDDRAVTMAQTRLDRAEGDLARAQAEAARSAAALARARAELDGLGRLARLRKDPSDSYGRRRGDVAAERVGHAQDGLTYDSRRVGDRQGDVATARRDLQREQARHDTALAAWAHPDNVAERAALAERVDVWQAALDRHQRRGVEAAQAAFPHKLRLSPDGPAPSPSRPAPPRPDRGHGLSL